MNPDVQEQLYREVEEVISKNDGDQNLSYNEIQDLQYLDQVKEMIINRFQAWKQIKKLSENYNYGLFY